jgi:hypothetical protein
MNSAMLKKIKGIQAALRGFFRSSSGMNKLELAGDLGSEVANASSVTAT